MTSRHVHADFSGTVWENSIMSQMIQVHQWLLMYIVPNLGSDRSEPFGGSLKILTVGAFSVYDFQTCARRFLRNCKEEFNCILDIVHQWLLMYIMPNIGSVRSEPSGGSLKILTVGAFSRYDFQTCAHRFLRNCIAEFNYILDNTSTLVVVDVHYSKFQI